jgi:hypothetical protein
MKLILLIIALVLVNVESKNFPSKTEILVNDFAEYENFFPIATLDLKEKGVAHKIHIMYVSFNYSGKKVDRNFPKGENMDCFTFKIETNGLYRPTFRKKAMVIDKLYKPYFEKTKSSYLKVKADNLDVIQNIQMLKQPNWLQNDATPINSLGHEYRFICQFESEIISSDDSWIYVFYDEHDKCVKYVHQRT